MNFLKRLALVLLLCVPGIQFADAQTVEERFQQLTPKQQEQILNQMNQAASANGHTSAPAVVSTTKGVLEWVARDGEAIGKGIAAIAREMGMVAVEFVNSDVGKTAVFLLVWHLFGSQVLHVFAGILFIIIGNYMLMTKIRPAMWNNTQVIKYKQARLFQEPVEAEKVVHRMSSEAVVGLSLMTLAINLMGIVIIFAF
jgi:hypothetical protein